MIETGSAPPWLLMITTAVLSLSLPAALAQSYSNISSIADGAGGRASSGACSNLSACAQPGGVAYSGGGELQNYAGFLGTFMLRAGLDTDADGLADEVDADNDGDGLSDTVELDGSAFDPETTTNVNKPDTDGDGADDGAEAAAGTDPTNALANLRFVLIADENPYVSVGWLARGGKTYVLRTAGDLVSDTFDHLATTDVAGGSAPWYATTNEFLDTTAGAAGVRFYSLEVAP